METNKEILIVGAGPSGLSVGIFLYDLGYQPTVIDKKDKISPFSKALGVNPRTLEILEEHDIAHKFLEKGRKMESLNLWKGEQFIYKNDLSKVKHRYPFMLILSQKESEEILLDELCKRKLNVEYGTEFISLEHKKSKYEATFRGKNKQHIKFDLLIGADGGHSRIREQLNIDYKGFKYDKVWELYDIELDTNLEKNEGHIILFKEGGIILIRLAENVWRVAGNLKNVLNYLPKNTKPGRIVWESKFRIQHKVAEFLTKGNVVLLGDAAHQHSPVGARGMNLGIEDAHTVSTLIHQNNLADYGKERKPYLDKTVNRINTMTMALAGDSILEKTVSNSIKIVSIIFPLIMPNARKFVMGLSK